MGGEPPPGYSSGGMRTKLVAARIATGAGCAMAIAVGHVERPLRGAGGGRALHLVPAGAGRAARRASAGSSARLQPLGSFTVDDGAARALADGRSLLPAGVRGGARAVSSAAMRWRCAAPDGRGAGARPVRLCQRRRRPHHRPPQRRHRGDPGLARPRRADPPRRSGAAVGSPAAPPRRSRPKSKRGCPAASSEISLGEGVAEQDVGGVEQVDGVHRRQVVPSVPVTLTMICACACGEVGGIEAGERARPVDHVHQRPAHHFHQRPLAQQRQVADVPDARVALPVRAVEGDQHHARLDISTAGCGGG